MNGKPTDDLTPLNTVAAPSHGASAMHGRQHEMLQLPGISSMFTPKILKEKYRYAFC